VVEEVDYHHIAFIVHGEKLQYRGVGAASLISFIHRKPK